MVLINCIYTIGYTAFSINEFIAVIKHYGINCVIDVRSSPFSNYYIDFNKDVLKNTLKKQNILYRNYALEFGARQSNLVFYSNDIVDFDKYIQSEQFLNGVFKIKKGIEMGYTFVLMCAEKDPINCHRSIMLGKGFSNNNFTVKHIISKTELESQKDIEERLLNLYYKDRFQITFFNEELSEEKLIVEAYKKQNIAIGYNRKINIEQGDEE